LLGHLPLATIGADHAPPTLTGTCGNDPGLACRLVWDLSHDVQATQVTDSYLSGPIHLALRVIFVVLLALVIRAVLHRLINRVTERATQAVLPPFRNPLPNGGVFHGTALRRVRLVPRRPWPGGAGQAGADTADIAGGGTTAETASAGDADVDSAGEVAGVAANGGSPGPTAAAAAVVESAIVAERRHQRVRALGSILRSAASVTILAIAGVVVLGDLGINLAPLLASAGVVGIALGFGAQNLVRDYLTGVFMLLEDQYGVGDVISVGDATGTVETMTLRITRMRDVKGIVWHIRNGTIDQVGNQSQGWARAVIDFPVPYPADLATIRSILDGVAEAAWDDPVLRGVMLEKPEVWGAQDVSSTVVTMRMVARTAPLRQWEVEREVRARVKTALDAAGIAPGAEPAAATAPADNTAPAAGAAARRHRRPSEDS
jgi:small conductance mechanosensitive channel